MTIAIFEQTSIQFPDYFHNPVLITVAVVIWLYCLAVLTVPRLRSMTRSSMFFGSDSPVGRGMARANTMQALFLLATLSVALVANLPIPPAVAEVTELSLAAVAVLSLLLAVTLVFFNWPRFLAPQKSMRSQRGAVREWIDRSRRG